MLGCLRLPADPEPDAQETSPPTGAPRTASGESLEGRFSFETMHGYVNAVLPMVRQEFVSDGDSGQTARLVVPGAGPSG